MKHKNQLLFTTNQSKYSTLYYDVVRLFSPVFLTHATYRHYLLSTKAAQRARVEQIELEKIEIVTSPDEYLLLSRFDDGKLAAHMQKIRGRHLYNKKYGKMISIEKIKEKQYDYYFTLVEHPLDSDRLAIKSVGMYIRVFSKGNGQQLPEVYSEIEKYVAEKGLILIGYAYEEVINEMIVSSTDDYITQIVVRCERDDD